MRRARSSGVGVRAVILLLSLGLVPPGAHAQGDPAPAATDDHLRVYGRAPPDTAGEHRVDQRLIAHKPARTADELLELVPGLYVVQHGSEGKGHQLYIRGFDALHGSDVEVRLEGVPLNEPGNVHGHGYVDLGLVMPEAIAGLMATRGVSEVTQGDFATAATIDLSLGVPPDDRGLMVALEGGSTSRVRGLARWATGDTLVALTATRDRGFGQNRDLRRAVGVVRGAVHLGQVRVAGFGAATHADFGLPTAIRLDDVRAGRARLTDSYSDDTGGLSQRVLGGVRLTARGDGLRLDAGAWAQGRRLRLDERFTGYLGDRERGDGHRQTHGALSAGFDARLRWRLGPRWRLLGALDGAVDDYAQRQVALADDGRLGAPAERDLRADRRRAALAGAARFRPWPWLSFEGGARAAIWRFDADDRVAGSAGDQTLLAVAPRVRGRAALGDWLVFAAYGRGMRPPEARATVRPPSVADAPAAVYRGGRAAVTLADHGELGARWLPDERVSITAAAFAVGIEREQVYDHVSATNVERGATRRIGLELDAAFDPWPWVHLSVGGAAVDAGFIDGGPIPGVPALLGRLESAVEHGSGVGGGLSLLGLGPRPLGDGAEAAPAVVVDAAVDYRWRVGAEAGAELTVELTVENLFDSAWREGEYRFASWWDRRQARSALPVIHAFAGAPRQLRLGASARW